MNFLTNLLVAKPLSIFGIACIFFIGYLIVRNFSHQHSAKYLGLTSILWLLYALWEFFVQLKSPDTNIRIDLLIIWPVIFILTFISMLLLFFKSEK
ncbi:hypothetical protein C3F34_01240 [Acinetobacter sp. ACNIH2]|jgi:hypothetical protein|uniref:hypothetical protein n=1 Tax=Acinetobacter TaxID=469 RepID=UPI0005CCD10E|nr:MULTISPECIES: hypothetical protein [unclassified Acinetobacter]AUX84830.1 hypothetical protein C3F34_01240 [Acinetobacter sp. ACNIH2]UOG16642.1 hypothetical protein MP622_08855 [Acinetobacter sp. PK01]